MSAGGQGWGNGVNYSMGWVKFCGRLLAVVSYDTNLQFENFATLREVFKKTKWKFLMEFSIRRRAPPLLMELISIPFLPHFFP